MNNPKYEKIEKYLAGNLKGDELIAFEKKLQEDADFAEEVRLYDEIASSIAHRIRYKDEERALRTTLTKVAKEQATTQSAPKVISLFGYKKWLVAASIALIIGIFVFQNGTPVYADYATHEAMDISVRGNANETLEKTQNAFNAKDYTLANTYLSKLTESYKDNTELQLYYGITLLETDQYDKAKIVFTKIANGDSLYKYKAIWYLGLYALKQNDLKACKMFLERIPNDAEEYTKAKRLLRKL